MKIICFGDSNTYGWDPRYFSSNYYEHPWPELLGELTGCEIVNMGQPGREIYYREYQFEKWLDPYINYDNHDLLIIMLGTNDILNSSVPRAQVPAERMETMIRHIKTKKMSSRILILAPPTIKLPDVSYAEAAEKYSRLLKELADREQLEFADTSIWNIPLAFDGIHLTEEAHRLFAEKVKNIIMEN